MAIDDREQRSILFTTLSTELLLLILERLPPSALLAVSRASRQFHYIALPIYLSHYKISNLDLEMGYLALGTEAMGALLGLRTSISLTSLSYLSCKFSGGNTHFTWEVHHLNHFISNLQDLTTVTLDLGNIDSRWINGLALINAKAWKAGFVRLLTGLVEKGCSCLVVAHGHFLPVNPPEIFVNTRKPRASFSGSVSSVATLWKPSSPSFGKRLQVQVPHSNCLKDVSIHSGLFFINPFYEWFMETLTVSPIHALSLRVSGISNQVWSTTLSRIPNIQTLSYFSAESVDIRYIDLMRFISRHPSIETLHLHPNFVYVGPWKLARHTKRVHLPKLHTLSGNPENIRDLLRGLRPLPYLHTVKISIPTQQSILRFPDFLKLERKISDAIQGVMPTELSLKFLVPYLVESQSQRKKPGPAHERSSPYFPTIRILRFSSDGHFAFVKWIIPVLPQWLATFPSLQHVYFANDCAPTDSDSRASFVRSLNVACTAVTLIAFGGEIHSVLHGKPECLVKYRCPD